MISKGYHYAIDPGIVNNFYISIGSAYRGSLLEDLLERVNLGESGSPFAVHFQADYPQ